VALYPAIQALEIALGNSLNATIAEAFDNPWWLDANPPILKPQEQESVKKAKEELARQRKPLEVGRVVAELSLGFWTSLLDARYEQLLWPRLLQPTFLHMPRHARTRKNLSSRFNQIRHLRNRVFHHEPIWRRDLDRQHTEILEAVGWISPSLRDTIRIVDRFSEVYTLGSNPHRERLFRFLRESGYLR